MERGQSIMMIILKAAAVGAPISSMVLGIAGVIGIEAQVTLLRMGLATLTIAPLSEVDEIKPEIQET